MRRSAKVLWWLAAAVAAVLWTALLIGPRMKDQPNRRTFYHPMRTPPAGTVTVDASPGVPTEAEAAKLANPLEATPANIERGRVYYRYYCLFCHGQLGDGNGEVGRSFIPAPADLRTPRVQRLSDGALCRAFLTGAGHSPVTEYTIPEAHRWPLVIYLRSLGAQTESK